jgi:hypothetical protein
MASPGYRESNWNLYCAGKPRSKTPLTKSCDSRGVENLRTGCFDRGNFRNGAGLQIYIQSEYPCALYAIQSGWVRVLRSNLMANSFQQVGRQGHFGVELENCETNKEDRSTNRSSSIHGQGKEGFLKKHIARTQVEANTGERQFAHSQFRSITCADEIGDCTDIDNLYVRDVRATNPSAQGSSGAERSFACSEAQTKTARRAAKF